MMVRTPVSEIRMPIDWPSDSRSRNSKNVHDAMMSGEVDWIRSALMASVYCRPKKAMVLGAAVPVIASAVITTIARRMTGQSRFRCGQAMGRRMMKAPTQRQNDTATGGT